MTFERTEDPDLIREIITHPRIWPHVSDDFATPYTWSPVIAPGVWYALVRDAGELLGLFMFVRHSEVLWEVHTCLLPHSWGDRAKQAAREVSAWMFQASGCQRIITHVPEDNRLALRFAQAAGMERYGCNPRSFMKGGRLVDQIELGLSREG